MNSDTKTLYLLWHDRRGGFFFRIARLAKAKASPRYEFRYYGEAFQDAHEHGLEPLLAFPDVGKIYKSDYLFPFFENRLMRKSRPDYESYVRTLGLDPDRADDIEILGRSGGERATDAFLLMLEPESIARDQYRLYFWAAGLGRSNAAARQVISGLQPGAALDMDEDDVLSQTRRPVGRLPEYVRALLSQNGAEKQSLQISVVATQPISPRRLLLCELVFRVADALKAQIPTAIPETQAHRELGRRALAVIGQRLSPELDGLVVFLCDGNLPELPPFARPKHGTFLDKPIDDSEMRIECSADARSLRLIGTDQNEFDNRMPVDFSRRLETQLELEDGSAIFAGGVGALSSASSIGPAGVAFHWQCQLRHWVWKKNVHGSAVVRYWVGLVPGVRLDYPWMNLGVTTLTSPGLKGVHVPGSPSLTLLHIDQVREDDTPQPGLALIVQATDEDADIDRHLYRITNMLSAALGIDEPSLFYGFNDSLQVVVCFSRDPLRANRDRKWLPVLPLSSERNTSEVRWPVPFLRCLRDRVFHSLDGPDLHLALIWFRFVLEEPYWESQFAKIGVVIRSLLQNAPGVGAVDWMSPADVSVALERVADMAKLNLPKEASAALDLSHRIAVLGDRGIRQSSFPALDDAASTSKSLPVVLDTLRVTFATLLAAAVGYVGPVVGRLHPIREWSQPHETRRLVAGGVPKERADQEQEARATFVAGDPDAFPW